MLKMQDRHIFVKAVLYVNSTILQLCVPETPLRLCQTHLMLTRLPEEPAMGLSGPSIPQSGYIMRCLSEICCSADMCLCFLLHENPPHRQHSPDCHWPAVLMTQQKPTDRFTFRIWIKKELHIFCNNHGNACRCFCDSSIDP